MNLYSLALHSEIICLFNLLCKLLGCVALWAAKVQENGYLRIQGRMQIFEKKYPIMLEITF